MTLRIGPTFSSELAGAGVALDGLSWNPETGELLFGTYDAGGFRDLSDTAKTAIKAVLAAHDPTTPAPPLVPDSATKLGLKRALDEAGHWAATKAAIASNAEAQEEWDLAIAIKRTDPLTQGIIAALSLPPDDVNHLLIRAAALTA